MIDLAVPLFKSNISDSIPESTPSIIAATIIIIHFSTLFPFTFSPLLLLHYIFSTLPHHHTMRYRFWQINIYNTFPTCSMHHFHA